MQISKILKYNMLKPVRRPASFNYSWKSCEYFLILAELYGNSFSMKLKSIFYILLASVAMLSIPSCDSLSLNGGRNFGQKGEDNEIAEQFRFILKEDVVELTTASIRIRHTGPSDVMWVYMQTQDLDTPADKLISERVKNEYAFTNRIVARVGSNISLPLDGLEVRSTYRIIVKAIDKDGNLYGDAASLIFKTRRNPDRWDVNPDWSLARLERTDAYRDGVRIDLENYQCTSSDSEPYIILSISKADWDAYEQNPDHKDKIRTLFEDYHKDFVSQKDFEKKILKGNAKWQEERLRSGDYVLFMIGLDEENELSGYYKRFDVTVEEETASDDYTKWTGVWEVSFPSSESHKPWEILIYNEDPNLWFVSYGWEKEAITSPVYEYPLELYYDRFTNKLYMISQLVGTGDKGEKLYYYGTFLYEGQKILLDYDNVRIAEIVPTNESATSAQIRTQKTSVANIGDIEFSYGLYYIRESQSSIAASYSIPNFPWEMKKIGELEDLDE